jgi:hypothetical protein
MARVDLAALLGCLAAGPASAPVALPGGRTVERVDFERHVMGVLTRSGCNAASCHGSFKGKGGFRLSLFAAEPDSDFRAIARDQTGRRIDVNEADDSLLLLKPTAQEPHGGGLRFGDDSWQYRLLNVWDTHLQNFGALKTRLLPELDQVLSTLIDDLDQRGLLDGTIVYCAGEFGRTPRINKGAGRDHWARSMSVLLAGGGFKGGRVHGSTDAQGESPATDPCTPDDVAATIVRQLGIDPHQELQTPSGRPVQLFLEGHTLTSLLV